jgi:hypothetical protein
MWKDPIVEEVRKIREEHAKKFDYDIHAICEDIRKQERRSRRKLVKLRPKRLGTPPRRVSRG